MPAVKSKPKATRARRAKKTPEKSPDTRLVAQPHGGALKTGGNPGNAGGPGRPPSAIRDELRLSYDQRKSFLDEVIDGKVLVQTEVPLAAVLPHIRCSSCAGPVVPEKVEDVFLLTFPGKQSATVKDRLAALEHQAKFAIGQLKEVSVENVRARVTETLRIIGLHCDAALAETLYQAIEPVWK